MTTRRLLGSAFWRLPTTGMSLGLALGALIGCVATACFELIYVFQLTFQFGLHFEPAWAITSVIGLVLGILIGAFVGACFGLAVGFIEAAALATVTRLLFFPLADEDRYRIVVRTLGVLVGIATPSTVLGLALSRSSTIFVSASKYPYAQTTVYDVLFTALFSVVFIVMPIVLAGAIGWWTSGWFANWYGDASVIAKPTPQAA